MNKKSIKWFIAFAGAIVFVLLLRAFAFTSYLIPSSGMENTLFQGERILVNKWSYGLRVPFMRIFSYRRWLENPVKKEDIVVFNNPTNTSQSVIDRREAFIGRCLGTPGDTLLIDSLFSTTLSVSQTNPDEKRLFSYPADKEQAMNSLLLLLSIKGNKLMGNNKTEHVRSFSYYEYYLLKQAINEKKCWIHLLDQEQKTELKPLVIPGKGKVLRVYPWNIILLRNTLVLHERKHAEVKNDTLYINGKATQHCYFTKDYYWMETNNAANLSGSRLFGFVPKDHIIGKASLIWFSKEPGSGLFNGYRWDRFFHTIQ